MDIQKFSNIVRRYLWLVVLVGLVAGLSAYFYLINQPASYRSTARLLVGPSLDSSNPDLNSLKIGGQLIQTYAEMVKTHSFLSSVRNKLDQKPDLDFLGSAISIRQNVDTRILTILVRDSDPKQAVAIANAVAETFIEISPSKDNTTALLRTQLSNQSHLLDEIITNSDASIQQLEAQLLVLGKLVDKTPEDTKITLERQNLIIKQLAEERARLSDAMRTSATVYQVLLDTNINQIEIIETAREAVLVDQKIPLTSATSGAAGLILIVCIIFILEYFDDTLRVPGDFTKIAGAPLLSTIDKKNRLTGTGLAKIIAFSQTRSLAANDYQTAVAKLIFSIAESMPYALMVSGVGSRSGDEAAEVAANLAVIFAQTGKKVVLVDAQLHNPVLTELFNVYDNPGLVDLPDVSPSKLQLIQVNEVPGLRLLPVGTSSKISSGVALNHVKIAQQIEELKKDADIVLVASSPISWFAEGLTLASLVDGIILVARQGDAHGKTVNDVVKNLRGMNTQLVGVIYDQNSLSFKSNQNLKNISEDVGVPLENGMSKKS